MVNEDRKILLQKTIQKIEAEIPIFKLSHGDIRYWPLLKMNIWMNNYSDSSSSGQPKFFKISKIFIDQFKNIFSDLVYAVLDHANSEKKYKKSNIFYLTHSTCRSNLGGVKYDIYFDPLILWAKKKYKEVIITGEEFSPQGDIRIPRAGKTIAVNSKFTFIKIKALCVKNNLTLDSSLLDNIDRILEKYHLAVINRKKIKYQLTFVRLLSRSYINILSKLKPNIVVVVCYYDLYGWSLLHAANLLEIETYDIQHGVQGNFHPAYMEIPIEKSKRWTLLPKFFLNWSEKEARNINSWGVGMHQGIVFGNVWQSFYKNNPDVFCQNEYSDVINAVSEEFDRCILITLQPNVYTLDEFVDIFNSLKDDAALAKTLFLIRLHPSMLLQEKDYSEKILNYGVDIHNTSRAPLFYLLDKIDLHITAFSSVTLEAAGLGKKTLLLEANNFYYQDLELEGLVYLKNSNECLSSAVIRVLAAPVKLKTQQLVDSKVAFLNLLERYFRLNNSNDDGESIY